MNEQILICAWCRPGATVATINPDWQNLGLTITHGICSSCAAVMKAPLKIPKSVGRSPAQILRAAMRRNALSARSYVRLGLLEEAKLGFHRAVLYRRASQNFGN